jgi:hypothetical protein
LDLFESEDNSRMIVWFQFDVSVQEEDMMVSLGRHWEPSFRTRKLVVSDLIIEEEDPVGISVVR